MKSFILIGVSDNEPRCLCSVQARSYGEAATKLKGISYNAVLVRTDLSKLLGTTTNYVVFRPGKDTGTVLESAIASLNERHGHPLAFGDYLKRYTDFAIAEVATV